MNFLIIIKLVGLTCFTVIADNQDSYGQFESAMNEAEQYVTVDEIEFYHTGLPVGSLIVGDAPIVINNVVTTCSR